MRSIRLAATVLLAVTLTACAPGEPMTEPTSTRPPFSTATPGPIRSSTGTPTDVPTARWAAIEADLAERDVRSAPELVSAERITFSDGSLGCPQPGHSYTQAQIDGMRVIVNAGGERYDYRFGHGDTPRLCSRR